MKKIGVFTSGGDAPGMNACIRSVVRTANHHGVEVVGFIGGYEGLVHQNSRPLSSHDVANCIQKGGTILKSSRNQDFKTAEGRHRAYQNLRNLGVEGLVCIGGDGSYTGAHLFHKEYEIPIVGCPGTIDNDLYGTDYTIGFDTAVNTVVDALDKIRDTAESHNQVFFVEVMGRHSGFIALYSGMAGGAEMIMMPEVQGELSLLIEHFNHPQKRKKEFSIILVAEGDEEGCAFKAAETFKKEVPHIDPKVTVLGHVQRGGNPTASDRILASRLGSFATLSLLKGAQNSAAGILNNQPVLTPLIEAASQSKKPHSDLFELLNVLSL